MFMLRTTLVVSACLLAAPASSATIIAGKTATPNGPAAGRTATAGSETEANSGFDSATLAWGTFAGLVLAGTMLRRRRPTSVIA